MTAAASCGGDSTAPRSAPPASIEIAAGDSQTGTVGRALGQKLSVRVRDANGKAVAGATVRWAVPANDGSISPASNTTNSDGAASATWTLGPSATSTVPATATVASLTPVIFHATRHAGPAEVVNVTAPAGFVLTTAATKFTATVTDEFGNPLPLSPVSWSTSDATLATVDQTGMVTGLRLSPAVTITATSAGHSGTATVGVVDKLLAVQTVDLNMPRITVAFDTTLAATGGGGGYAWSVTSGQLPSGLVMQSNGHLSGTATTSGTYPFTATVRDVYNATASRAFTMTVCAAPVSPALGATLIVKFPDTCGVALPGITDAAYRVGIMARSVPSPLGAVLVGGGLQLRAKATGAPTVAVRVNPTESTPRNTDGVADAATWQLIQSTERVHLRLREDEIRQFGGSRSTPLQPVPARLVATAPPPPPQTRTVFV
ncbi:MAG TPA: Ig-like domain-containing protein, partial [Gemmatimonadaceae bacterium]|nr:Ig-like domain-containing protein [Gemmatimonadaceae bacterium]